MLWNRSVERVLGYAARDVLGRPCCEVFAGYAGLAALEDLYRYDLMATEDAAEGLRALLEKRKPVWRDR
jgi:hypothetical protein